MKKTVFVAVVTFLLIAVSLLIPAGPASAQSWTDINVEASASKDQGKLTARYRTAKSNGKCSTTIELKNVSGKSIMDFKLKITFKDISSQERKGAYISSGSTVQWTYESCGVDRLQVSDVK